MSTQIRISSNDGFSILVSVDAVKKFDFFKCMFSGFKETNTRVLNLDYSSKAIKVLNDYLNETESGVLEIESYADWEEILRLADYLQLDELFELTASEIPEDANIQDVIVLAQIWKSKRLYDDVARILKNAFNDMLDLTEIVECIITLEDAAYKIIRDSWKSLIPLANHMFILLSLDMLHLEYLSKEYSDIPVDAIAARYLKEAMCGPLCVSALKEFPILRNSEIIKALIDYADFITVESKEMQKTQEITQVLSYIRYFNRSKRVCSGLIVQT